MTKRFIPPTLEEIKEAIAEKGYSVDAKDFFYHYAATDWFRGKTKMVYWKMALAGWSHRNDKTKIAPISSTEKRERYEKETEEMLRGADSR